MIVPDELTIIPISIRNPHAGLVVFWLKLRQRGCSHSILVNASRSTSNMFRLPASLGDASGQKFYQYTTLDEFSRFRYVEAFEEYTTYTSTVFPEHMLLAFPFPVHCVQTDNGFEFTKRFAASKKPEDLTTFEKRLRELEIEHRKIRPYTPRHNGKVERSHRKDNEYFCAVSKFYCFSDFKTQLQRHNRRYNAFPTRPLGWVSPKDTLFLFLMDGVTYV